MSTVQWRPEVNALTVPQSYKIRYIPRGSSGTDTLAAMMVEENPNYTVDDAKTQIAILMRVIKKTLINGNQATIEGALTFGLSFSGRLDSPDDPLPPVDETLHINVHVLPPLLNEVKQEVHLKKLPMAEKVPLIEIVEDTRLHLNDVLYSEGVLRLNGTNLLFDPEAAGSECVIEGLQSGRAVQMQFGPISETEIITVPDIPEQDEAWQNEYTVSVTTRYTAHGTPRSGTYRNRLRSVLVIERLAYETGPGILSRSTAAAPYVTYESATATGPELLRIQAVFDVRNNWLQFSLLSKKKDGPEGAAVVVTADGSVTVPGFAGSLFSEMTIVVQNYAALLELVRDYYYGRLVDVLDMKAL